MISIIITVYNKANFLKDAIESALRQNCRDKEIIIVDGSTDNSAQAVLSSYGDEVTVIKHGVNPSANEFRAILRNRGILAAKGGYFVFLDDDDMLHPDMIPDTVEYMDAHHSTGMVYTGLEFIDAGGAFLDSGRNIYNFHEGQIFKNLLLSNCIAVHTALVPRAVIEKTGMFDESLPTANDWDLWIRISRHFSVGHLPRVRAYYRIHNDSFHSNKRKMLEGNIALAEKYLAKTSTVSLDKEEKNILISSVWYNKAKIEYKNNNIPAAAILMIKSLFICPQRIKNNLLSNKFMKREKLSSRAATARKHG